MPAERRSTAAATAAGLLVLIGVSPAVAAPAFTVSGVSIVAGAGTPPLAGEQQQRITATLARLPAPVRARPVVIQRVPGLACAADGLPRGDDWWDARANTVGLCEGPARDLPRQIALAVLFAFDAGPGAGGSWSDSATWRSIAGWRASALSGWRPFAENSAVRAHVGTGMGSAAAAPQRALTSPRWDLVTFAAAVFLDDVAGDDAVVCQLRSQAAFLHQRLRALGVTEASLPRPSCVAFERWADLDNLEDVELVLAAPSNAMVGSMFGHLFLRLRYRSADGEAPAEAGRTVAFLADNDAPFGDDPAYAVKGIFGRYSATLHERPFLATYREYAILEGRDLRRWRLNLTGEQRRRLLEGIWTLERAGSYRYYFFARNCATLLVDLINGALDSPRPITVPGVLAAPPASIVEQFEAARTAAGEPLARYVPEPIVALDHQARAAAERRRGAETRLLAALPGPRGATAAAIFARTHASDAEARAAAYRELAPILAPAGAGAAEDVHLFLRDSALLESHLSTVANLEEEQRTFAARRVRLRAAVARLGASLHAHAPSGGPLALATAQIEEDDRQRRMEGYVHLASHIDQLEGAAPTLARRARLLVLLQSEVRYDVTRMKAVPGLRDALLFVDRDRLIDEQPYLRGGEGEPVTGAEASALLALPVVTRVGAPLRALQDTKQAVFAARPMAVSDSVLRGEGDVPSPEAVARAHGESLSRSGIDQVSVMGGVLASGSAPSLASVLASRPRLDAGVVLGGALYDERLGEHRRFGFPSHTAFTVARSTVLVTGGGGGLPRVAAHDARWFGYRTLRPSLPESGGSTVPLGWELWLDTRGNAGQALAAAVSGGWGFVLRLWERDALTDHLIVTGGVAYEAIFPTAAAVGVRQPQVAGTLLGLELRRGLGSTGRRSHLAARVFARPGWIAWGAPSGLAVDVGGSVECQLALRGAAEGGAHDPALVFAFQTLRSSVGLTGTGPALHAMLAVGIALR